MKNTKKVFSVLKYAFVFSLIGFLYYHGYQFYKTFIYEKQILEQMVERLEAESRIAEVLVIDVEYQPITQKHMTTIKFLEYDSQGEPMLPKYFTFAGNIIQFQSLVVRFDDVHVKGADALRGKSAYLFWKVFLLDGQNTQEYPITEVNAIPEGYKIPELNSKFEEEIWQKFWEVALNPKNAAHRGIKNAQIEAPGTKFISGLLYTMKIEHDGGIRIDAEEIPAILRGETIKPLPGK